MTTGDDVLYARALAAARSIPYPPCRRKDPTVKFEEHPHADHFHDPLEDVSSRRRVTGVELEVVDLLELDPAHRPWLRLSEAAWRRVDALVARIERADAIPTPRAAGDGATVRGGAR